MSVRALTVVFDCRVGSSSLKSVLIALADRMDDKTGLCFPSVQDTVERTELNEKTVQENLALLKNEKILVDTGNRTGRTKQIPIYFFDLKKLVSFSEEKAPQNRNTSVFGTHPNFQDTPPKTEGGTPPKSGDGTTTLSVIVTTTQNQEVGGENINEIIDALVWHQKLYSEVKNEVGFRRFIRGRIKKDGVTEEDCLTLKNYKKHLQIEEERKVINKKLDDIVLDKAAQMKGQELLDNIRNKRRDHANSPC